MYHNVIARKVTVPALLYNLDSSISLPGVPDSKGNKTKTKACLFMCMSRFDIHLYHCRISLLCFVFSKRDGYYMWQQYEVSSLLRDSET
jgi:hypothetical protein